MYTACKRVCNECPFSKESLPGWLADYTPLELHQIVMNERPFPCHKTHQEDIPWSEAGRKEYPLCRGALIYMKKNAKSPRNHQLNALVVSVDSSEYDLVLSVPEFFQHHDRKNK